MIVGESRPGPYQPCIDELGGFMLDLFADTDASGEGRHDPGGRSVLRLKPGVVGDALFYDEGECRRLWLSRERLAGTGTVLWIGMNPSMGTALVDDPTLAAEQVYSWRWGFRRYVKANVMDYRVTDQKGLMAPGVIPCGPRNIETIRSLGAQADRIMLTYGAPHKSLDRHGRAVVDALQADGRSLFCLALTKAGHPGHPLRRRADLEPFPFPGYQQGAVS